MMNVGDYWKKPKVKIDILKEKLLQGLLFMPANALAMSESDRPTGVIGLNLLLEMYYKYSEEDVVTDYTITMGKFDGKWLVSLEGEAEEFEDYSAIGCYDHCPTEDEINVLWANRVTSSELDDIMGVIG